MQDCARSTSRLLRLDFLAARRGPFLKHVTKHWTFRNYHRAHVIIATATTTRTFNHVQYVEEKSLGLYGGSRRQQQQFAIRLFEVIDRLEGVDFRGNLILSSAEVRLSGNRHGE
jgi:hypothetical protein